MTAAARRRRGVAGAVAALGIAMSGAVAAMDFTFPFEPYFTEGDGVDGRVELEIELDEVTQAGMYVTVLPTAGTAGVPDDAYDVCAAGCPVEVPSYAMRVPLGVVDDDAVEPTESFMLQVTLHAADGTVLASDAGEVFIADDDEAQAGGFLALRDDRYELRENEDLTLLDVLDNDTVEGLSEKVEITGSNGNATLSVDDGGTPGDFTDDRVAITPLADFSGTVTFAYELCAGTFGCRTASVLVLVRPALVGTLTVDSDGGFRDVVVNGLRALPAARFVATELVAPTRVSAALDVDTTPYDPYDDAGGGVHEFEVPLPPASGSRRIVVSVFAGSDDMDLFVTPGPGVSGTGCTSTSSSGVETCGFDAETSGTGLDEIVVRVQNRSGGPAEFLASVYDVPMPAVSGPVFRNDFVATGPGAIPAGEQFLLRLSWFDPTLVGGDDYARLGFVRVFDGPTEIGMFPVNIVRGGGGTRQAVALPELAQRTVALLGGESHERIFVDVPVGTDEMFVHFTADTPVTVHLAHDPAPSVFAPDIAAAPARESAAFEQTGASGEFHVAGNALTPGRWYVTPTAAGVPARVTLQVLFENEGEAPVARPGSYFHPERGGHGLFVYPAGGGAVTTALWYTYFQDGTPTWLYAQGDSPGPDGNWTAGLYRAAWHGGERTLTYVGTAVITATGDDTFRWTYTLDGETGSEPMQALGRGCPTLGGVPVDSSATWFDPAHPGTGYSTQLWPGDGYEYYAAFVYDGLGVPRFLTAEAPEFLGADADLDLEQLIGFCPLCARAEAPLRLVVGTLDRSYAGGTLESILLEATYAYGVPGVWASEDHLVPLGGEGATQGCGL